MKRGKADLLFSVSRQRSIRLLIILGFFYFLFVIWEVPLLYKIGAGTVSQEELSSNGNGIFNSKSFLLESEENLVEKKVPIRNHKSKPNRRIRHLVRTRTPLSRLNFTAGFLNSSLNNGILKSALGAVELGRKVWQELQLLEKNSSNSGYSNVNQSRVSNSSELCPSSITVNADEFSANGGVMVLPCGLALGSHITVVGTPWAVRPQTYPAISGVREGQHVMASQFMMELQGLNTVEGEEPPRILHFNPRLKGDWTSKPVIEMNTCYRMQWAQSQRCEGWKSGHDEETVDGLVKCEKWIRSDDKGSEESEGWWLNRFVGQTKKPPTDWPFPFVEEKLFVLTLKAGVEGYHVNVDGRHVTSFPYRTGYTLEDATGFLLKGDLNVHLVLAASLPTSHPGFAPQRHLDLSKQWKAPRVRDRTVELFIGILSAGNHFAERMAVRKSWMQHKLIRSSHVVVRFFVALSARKEINIELKKEAEFFGDIVIVPYMDNYDLVVLKTVAICEYGVKTLSAKYIMKGDDDTFVRVGAIIKEARKMPVGRSFYMGNMNYYHRPLRLGKWAVTHEEWPEEVYPPYANGPGYIISSDIANSVLSDFEHHNLRLFKMEDVSMGMWVEKVHRSGPVLYAHSLRFCQSGCIEDYITAHYQSPQQMICLWDKLREHGRPSCCNI